MHQGKAFIGLSLLLLCQSLCGIVETQASEPWRAEVTATVNLRQYPGLEGKIITIEDTLFAGALAEKLIESGRYTTICDSTVAAVDLWVYAREDIMAYMEKVAQRSRLRKNKLDDVIEYCHTFDVTDVIPVLRKDFLEVLGDPPGKI